MPVGSNHILLINRVTVLDPAAGEHLLACVGRVAAYNSTPAMIVGATRCERSGEVATSGLNRRAAGSKSYDRVAPTLALLPVDTFDFNCLLVPGDLLERIRERPAAPGTGHHVRRLGYAIFLAPHYLGTCPIGPRHGGGAPAARRGRPGFASLPSI